MEEAAERILENYNLGLVELDPLMAEETSGMVKGIAHYFNCVELYI